MSLWSRIRNWWRGRPTEEIFEEEQQENPDSTLWSNVSQRITEYNAQIDERLAELPRQHSWPSFVQEIQDQWVDETRHNRYRYNPFRYEPIRYRDITSLGDIPERDFTIGSTYIRPEPLQVGDRVELLEGGEADGICYSPGLRGTIISRHKFADYRVNYYTGHYWNVEWDDFRPQIPSNHTHGFDEVILKKITQEHCIYCKSKVEREVIGDKTLMVCTECYRTQED